VVTGSDARFDDGDFEVWAGFGESVRRREPAGSGTDNHHIRFRVLVQIFKVAPRHGAGDGGLPDGGEGEGFPFGRGGGIRGF